MADPTKPRFVQVTSPLLYRGEHQDEGEILLLSPEDAAACVTAGRAKLLTDEEAEIAIAAAAAEDKG